MTLSIVLVVIGLRVVTSVSLSTLYTQVFSNYSELDTQFRMTKHLSGRAWGKLRSAQVDSVRYTNLVFLSARPHVYKDYSERVSYRLFRQLVKEGRLHSMPTLVPGKLGACIGAVVKGLCNRTPMVWKAVGYEKFLGMKRLKQLNPNYDMVFFGDNGQGDLLAAELALQENPPLISAAFINEVVQPRGTASLTSLTETTVEARENRWKELGVVWTRTAIDAAVECVHKDLISSDALARICDSAKQDLEALAVRTPDWPHWEERCGELNESIFNAQQIRPGLEALNTQQVLQEVALLNKANEKADTSRSFFLSPVGASIPQGETLLEPRAGD